MVAESGGLGNDQRVFPINSWAV